MTEFTNKWSIWFVSIARTLVLVGFRPKIAKENIGGEVCTRITPMILVFLFIRILTHW